MKRRLAILLFAAPLTTGAGPAPTSDPDERAARMLAQMTQAEKLTILQGYQTARAPEEKRPSDILMSAGFVPGVSRLGIPVLVESDASLGVANMGGFMRSKDEATAMPSALAMGSTWDPALIEETGRIMGAETRAIGFNVLLAGGINLVREPRNGRNFEYFSEDPLLSGVLGGHSVKGIQSNHVVSTLKHYLLNAQETGRTFADVRMDEAALRESDLLAFQLAIEIGQPGSIMCSYNKINGTYACENSFLLNDVLRRDWGYKGWVMSDWGAVHSVSIRQGLDQESGTQVPAVTYFGQQLSEALAAGRVTSADIDRSVLRILRTTYALGLFDDPLRARQPIDFSEHLDVAQRAAEQGIVLLKNVGNLLPVAATAKRILVVGGHADIGVPQGGGSSQVWPVGGASLALAIPGEPIYHRRLYMPSSPLSELKAQFPGSVVGFDDGKDLARLEIAAKKADLTIVFAEQFTAEGHDALSLSLPENQDAVIERAVSANPRTVVVLETGGPVLMPWLSKVPAVLQAWYPGNRGGRAIARILSGAVNPSGRLPITFPAAVSQIPNPNLPGAGSIRLKEGTGLYDLPETTEGLTITYPEGAEVGYRWYAKKRAHAEFPFGHGLSYTSFETNALRSDGRTATFMVRNTGRRTGATVAQLYMVSRGGRDDRRLLAFQRVELEPGESRKVSVSIDQRLLADWKGGGWTLPNATYRLALGQDADHLGAEVGVRISARRWRDYKTD